MPQGTLFRRSSAMMSLWTRCPRTCCQISVARATLLAGSVQSAALIMPCQSRPLSFGAASRSRLYTRSLITTAVNHRVSSCTPPTGQTHSIPPPGFFTAFWGARFGLLEARGNPRMVTHGRHHEQHITKIVADDIIPF